MQDKQQVSSVWEHTLIDYWRKVFRKLSIPPLQQYETGEVDRWDGNCEGQGNSYLCAIIPLWKYILKTLTRGKRRLVLVYQTNWGLTWWAPLFIYQKFTEISLNPLLAHVDSCSQNAHEKPVEKINKQFFIGGKMLARLVGTPCNKTRPNWAR